MHGDASESAITETRLTVTYPAKGDTMEAFYCKQD